MKVSSSLLLIRNANILERQEAAVCCVSIVISGRSGNWLAASKDYETEKGFGSLGSVGKGITNTLSALYRTCCKFQVCFCKGNAKIIQHSQYKPEINYLGLISLLTCIRNS